MVTGVFAALGFVVKEPCLFSILREKQCLSTTALKQRRKKYLEPHG